MRVERNGDGSRRAQLAQHGVGSFLRFAAWKIRRNRKGSPRPPSPRLRRGWHGTWRTGIGAIRNLDLRAGFAPASAVYETAASLPMLAESEDCRGMSCTCASGSKVRGPTARRPGSERGRMAAGAWVAHAFAASETAVLLLDDPAMADAARSAEMVCAEGAGPERSGGRAGPGARFTGGSASND